MEEAAKTAKQSAEAVSKGGEKLGRTAAFKALSRVSWAGARACRRCWLWLASRLSAEVPASELSPREASLRGAQRTGPRPHLASWL